ncbi:MAG: XrtA-associated tyrosine autokinase [Gammaproteobacteria bacterium]|nr:XrtA-associated tyrosine autokinase [Gammaproteobacteria bacterium]
MNHDVDKKESGATITELVATSDEAGSQFFRDTSNNSAEPEPLVEREADKVLIEDRLRSENMLVNGSLLSPQSADEYRRIKRPLLSNAFGKSSSLVEKGNLILVTSSIPGEGKTHTAINLALSIAHERDHTVMLVDCDVTRHGTSRMLGIADRPGLVDIIESDSFTVGDALLRTDIPELTLLSAGKQHDFVTELLASKKMSELVAEIGERYDDRVIIFDGPPLLPTPQTQVLTELVGQVVFVVETGKTPQSLVNEALDMIPEEQATGLVMNKSEGISSRSSYYYGYYGSE